MLIVCYSFEGNTAYAAEALQKATGAELLRICPTLEPPRRGLAKMIHGGSMALRKVQVELKPYEIDWDAHDTVVLCSPVWAGYCPPAMTSFLAREKERLSGRSVWLVGCSMSGNAVKMFDQMRKALPGCEVRGSISLVQPLKHREETEKKMATLATGLK